MELSISLVGDLLYCVTETRPLPAVKLTWTACDIIGHINNCQVDNKIATFTLCESRVYNVLGRVMNYLQYRL